MVIGFMAKYQLGREICDSNGISPCLIGNTSSKGTFFIAMLVYQSVVF